jgi:cation diffusion facilitator family transporter
VKNKTERLAGFTALFLVGIGALQVILGETVSKSVALTANGIDCIGDGFVSSVVWVGLKFFRRPADRKFHYGYYKLENLASVIAAVVMLLLAIYIAYRSYLQLINPHEIHFPALGAVIALVAAAVAISLGIAKYRRSREMGLSSVKLEAFNTIKDGTASLMTVVALVLAGLGYPIADALVGFVISLIILSVGFAAIKEAGFMLVDACDSSCLTQEGIIRSTIDEMDGIRAADLIRLRRTGPVYQGELVLQVPGEMTVAEVEKIKERIHASLQEAIPDMEPLTIIAVPFEDEDGE